MPVMTRAARAKWERFQTTWRGPGWPRERKTTENTQRLHKLEPGVSIYQYNLEKTSFEHIPQCHRAKKQLLHDLFWVPGANRFLRWVARRYDAGRVKLSTPEPSECETWPTSTASSVANDDDEGDDDSALLLSKIHELDGHHFGIGDAPSSNPQSTNIITNPDPVPPSPSTIHELYAEPPLSGSKLPALHETITSIDESEEAFQSLGEDDPTSGRRPSTTQASPARGVMKKTKQVRFGRVSYRSDSTSKEETLPITGPDAATLSSPPSAAFAAFNKDPNLLERWVDVLEPRRCRLYVRALESYTDGIIGFEKGDKLLVTAQRGQYYRYEPRRSVEGWFPKVYCEVIGAGPR